MSTPGCTVIFFAGDDRLRIEGAGFYRKSKGPLLLLFFYLFLPFLCLSTNRADLSIERARGVGAGEGRCGGYQELRGIRSWSRTGQLRMEEAGNSARAACFMGFPITGFSE